MTHPQFDFGTHKGKTDTSAQAGEKMDSPSPTLRHKVYGLICDHTLIPQYGGLTADECAGILGEDILSIRPRLSELREKNYIQDSGKRRRS